MVKLSNSYKNIIIAILLIGGLVFVFNNYFNLYEGNTNMSDTTTAGTTTGTTAETTAETTTGTTAGTTTGTTTGTTAGTTTGTTTGTTAETTAETTTTENADDFLKPEQTNLNPESTDPTRETPATLDESTRDITPVDNTPMPTPTTMPSSVTPTHLIAGLRNNQTPLLNTGYNPFYTSYEPNIGLQTTTITTSTAYQPRLILPNTPVGIDENSVNSIKRSGQRMVETTTFINEPEPYMANMSI